VQVFELGSENLELCSGSSCFQICTVRISKKCLKTNILGHFLQIGHSEAILPKHMLGPLGVKSLKEPQKIRIEQLRTTISASKNVSNKIVFYVWKKLYF
jgi:hypothetical protein